jgi:hypothetical protein
MQHRLYCEVVKIETPEASVSGVFNLRALNLVKPLAAMDASLRFLLLFFMR